MLGKLIKYSNKSIVRIMAPVYLVLACVTIISQIIFSVFSSTGNTLGIFIRDISCFIQILTILAAAFACVGILIWHYYQNILCDQAYFTFTLPASIKSHIVANSIVGIIWMFLTTVLCALAALLLTSAMDYEEYIKMLKEFKKLFTALNSKLPVLLLVILGVIIVFLLYLTQALIMQLCFAAGQIYTSHKILGSIIAYIIVSTIAQILSGLPVLPILIRNGFKDQQLPIEAVPTLFTGVCIYVLVLTIASYLLTNYFLSKRLNLD